MERRFTILASLCCACLVASNIFETVIFTAGPLTLTGGLLIFPVSYIINDCITEVYGFNKAKFTILLAFATNLAFVFLAQLVCLLPEAPMAEGLSMTASPQEHFSYIFKTDLRITAASMLAFLSGSLVNSLVMTRMKTRRWTRRGDDGGFGWRAVLSSLIGETADSAVFFPIAFGVVGMKNMLTLMVTQIVLKTLYEVLILPVTSCVVKYLKKC